METALNAMLELDRNHHAARESSEQRSHELHMAHASALRETLASQGRAIEQFVAPIGPSVTSALISPAKASPVLLTAQDADAIREQAKLEWQPIAPMTLRTDGFKFHTSGLSVENPERDGFLMARVHDPKFEEGENVYTEAAQRRSAISVLARKGYKGGELVAIEILEFQHEIP